MKKIISLCLALVLLLAVLVGCVQTPGNPDDPTNPTINKTDIKIVDGGKTEYKVVVPSGENGFVTTAASELVNFVKEATGATLPVVSDGEEFSVSAKVISLGNTTVFESSGVKLTEKLRETGYVMKRKGNTLIINAKDDNGVVSAVYDMLGYSLGLEFYSYDEYSLDKTDTMYMLDFDLEFVPSIDIRDIMMRSLNTNYRQRMRLYAGKGLGQWITFAHTTTGASNLKNGSVDSVVYDKGAVSQKTSAYQQYGSFTMGYIPNYDASINFDNEELEDFAVTLKSYNDPYQKDDCGFYLPIDKQNEYDIELYVYLQTVVGLEEKIYLGKTAVSSLQ